MIKEEAKRKARILNFWHKHGLEESKLKESKGKLESLNNQSRKPKTIKKRIVPEPIELTYLVQYRQAASFAWLSFTDEIYY